MEERKEAKYGTWMVIGVVLLLMFSLLQSFTILQHKQSMNPAKISVASSSAGAGETYEQMMARMHPDQAASQSGSGMVGGC